MFKYKPQFYIELFRSVAYGLQVGSTEIYKHERNDIIWCTVISVLFLEEASYVHPKYIQVPLFLLKFSNFLYLAVY